MSYNDIVRLLVSADSFNTYVYGPDLGFALYRAVDLDCLIGGLSDQNDLVLMKFEWFLQITVSFTVRWVKYVPVDSRQEQIEELSLKSIN